MEIKELSTCPNCGKEFKEIASLLNTYENTINVLNKSIINYKDLLNSNNETVDSYHNMAKAYLEQITKLSNELQSVKSQLALKELELMNRNLGDK